MKAIFRFIFSVTIVAISACSDDYLDPTLTQDKINESQLKTAEEMKGVANGMYYRMTVTPYYGRNYIIYGEVRADNVFANGATGKFPTVGKMQVGASENWPVGTWSAIYEVIASANVLIAQDLENITGNQAEIKHIAGQAYVVRALAHFDLLKLYGQQHAGGDLGIPYVKSYNNASLAPARESVNVNRQNIYSDIDKGLELMSETKNDKTKQFITTYAAHALKARVALYFGDWEIAKAAAQEVIDSGKFQIVEAEDFIKSWKGDSAINSVFELAFSTSDKNGINSLQYIYSGENYGDIEVLPAFPEIFDSTDIRVSRHMMDTTTIKDKIRLQNIGKYPSEYSNIPLIRYEEVILILAEAKAELGEPDALEILNQIPAQRNAALYTEASKENILLERRKEFAFEGFRFDDLARNGMDIPVTDSLLQSHGGPRYGSYNFAFPIPVTEMNANRNMIQNDGY